ncbi:unnamed protein product [Pleuronectes platessa]|uniref:Uncharacterized protein n=1 Tax=Pleuronectes platessa TaxID=8262 RepID=A0A9N7VIG7_PLEPL|nr:unnamed protein product [Pleuronectes platessa]
MKQRNRAETLTCSSEPPSSSSSSLRPSPWDTFINFIIVTDPPSSSSLRHLHHLHHYHSGIVIIFTDPPLSSSLQEDSITRSNLSVEHQSQEFNTVLCRRSLDLLISQYKQRDLFTLEAERGGTLQGSVLKILLASL